ncbi:DNA-processing protein DprA [Bacteroides sp. 519]|uniref:DNA-processing protein DprA n=1 Tax=Bacteroides sp. 519 TaxID=2302937 RepID=UPI0013D53A39|nr:DNA-processing protein DprA [Bacteroides sp. 519]NDV57527.1 DNA-protecting protein DprA [Bacteroides sp. 519]
MSIEENIYAIALTQVPGIGHVWARNLINAVGSATKVFESGKHLRELMPGITPRIIEALNCSQAIDRAKQEYEFIEKNKITCLPITCDNYPERLCECSDAPIVLFFKGNTNLNASKIVSIVGTRNISEYGKQMCSELIAGLQKQCPDALIVSGLAYGVDICIHRASIENNLATVAVLAHGLDRIYPSSHRKTAVDMLSNGGLLTEYITQTNPDRFNFVGRNRIVAGISDATIVVESAAKGGSLITADIAGSYNRDCFAFPGRATDDSSRGCNQLIRDNKAGLIQSPDDFIKMMGWGKTKAQKPAPVQRSFFPDLSDDEQLVVNVLEKEGKVQINSLVVTTNIPVYKMNSLLFELEMKGVIRVLAGGVYQLV